MARTFARQHVQKGSAAMATDPDRRVPPIGTSRSDPRSNAGLWLVCVVVVIAVLLLLLSLSGVFDEVTDTATTPAPTRSESGRTR